MHIRIFESSQLEGSYVGDLLYKNSYTIQNFKVIKLTLSNLFIEMETRKFSHIVSSQLAR